MSNKVPVVVSLEYIKSLENSIRWISYTLQEVNCSNLNLGLADDIDIIVSQLKNIRNSLIKITDDPSRFALQTSL